MKKIFAYIVTGLFLLGSTVIAQAGGDNLFDFLTEDPAQDSAGKTSTVKTIVVDEGPLYIEGMGFAPRPKGPKTVVPKVASERDWCSEDMSKEEEERHFKKVNKIEPAAGY